MAKFRLLFTIPLLLAMSVFAQTPTGTISGLVTDPTGGSLAAAAVTITDASTNETRTVTTDSAGRYNVPSVPPATYVVKVVAPGFRPASKTGVIVEVAGTSSVDFSLTVGNVSQEVQVTADMLRIDTESSNLSVTISTQEILDLPDNGRNPFDFASLAPAVSNVGNASTPHIGGSRNGNNEQLIDGMTNILPENNVGNNFERLYAGSRFGAGIKRSE